MPLTPEDKLSIKNSLNENESLLKNMQTFEKNFNGNFYINRELSRFNSYETALKAEKNLLLVFIILCSIILLIFGIATSNSQGMFIGILFTCFLISMMYLLFLKSYIKSLIENIITFENNKSGLETYYDCKNKIELNKKNILRLIEPDIIFLTKSQPMLSIEQVRKSVLNFLPDAYITEILDEEVKKGLFEKIELAVPNAKSTQFVYKSTSNSNKMNTSRIDLD